MANTYQEFLFEEALHLIKIGVSIKDLIKDAFPYISEAYNLRGIAYTHFGALDSILGRKHTMFIFDLETNE